MLGANEISFSCKLSNLQIVRECVRSHLENEEMTTIDKGHIVLAIDEVCANLIIHSNKSDETKKIFLELTFVRTPRGVAVEIIEKGIPFDYLKYQEPNILDLKNNKANGKMGMMLVRRIMDKIEYFQRDNHNICRLFKSLA